MTNEMMYDKNIMTFFIENSPYNKPAKLGRRLLRHAVYIA